MIGSIVVGSTVPGGIVVSIIVVHASEVKDADSGAHLRALGATRPEVLASLRTVAVGGSVLWGRGACSAVECDLVGVVRCWRITGVLQ